MFGWRSRACTLDAPTRTWVDQRWQWLTTKFGAAVHDAPMVLPTPEYFPDRYDRSDGAVRTLVERVCGYMKVDPGRVDLEFMSRPMKLWLVNDAGHYVPGAAGTFSQLGARFVIHLERDQFDQPATLVGTVSRELAHARLLGEGRLARGAFDNELLTDLTAVYHGLGIFLANCPRHWNSQVSTWPGTDSPRPEYMTTAMYGYALARRAWMRHEHRPTWKRYLKPGARAEFEQALRFLQHEAHD